MNERILICLAAVVFSCSNQQETTDQTSVERWVKGNLHTHSYWSDGDEFPEVILEWYKSNNYQFVALSDHNTIAQGDKWIEVSEDDVYQQAFGKYLANYGEEWVEYRMDSGRVIVKLKTYEEYSARVEKEDQFLIIRSQEITDRFENKNIHVNATNIQEKIAPQGGESVLQMLQNNIDAVIQQRRETGIPMIPHVNHPNFTYSLDVEDMKSLRGERFFEVYNGHPSVHNLGDSIHISTEEMWDMINIAYLENDQPLMYGLATDDSHHYHEQGDSWANAGRGWIMVQTDSLTAGAVIRSMEAGDFYASTGVALEKLVFENDVLTVEVIEEAGISYTLSFVGSRNGNPAEVLKTVEGSKAEFVLTEDVLFVRCQITSSKLHANPIEQMRYEMAWTQPVVRR